MVDFTIVSLHFEGVITLFKTFSTQTILPPLPSKKTRLYNLRNTVGVWIYCETHKNSGSEVTICALFCCRCKKRVLVFPSIFNVSFHARNFCALPCELHLTFIFLHSHQMHSTLSSPKNEAAYAQTHLLFPRQCSKAAQHENNHCLH